MSTDEEKPKRRPTGWIVACGLLAVAAVGLAIWAFSAQSDADDVQARLDAQEQAATPGLVDAETRQRLEQLATELGATGVSLDAIEQQLEQAAAKVEDAKQARDDAGNAIEAVKAEAEAFKAQFELTQTCLGGTLDAVSAAFAGGGAEAAVQELETLSGNGAQHRRAQSDAAGKQRQSSRGGARVHAGEDDSQRDVAGVRGSIGHPVPTDRPVRRTASTDNVLRRAGDDLTADGRRAQAWARARLEQSSEAVLAAPEVERALDRLPAGQLTDAVARSLAEHRVVERVAAQIVATGDLDRVVAAVLDDELTEQALERALESPGLERLVVRVLESRLVDGLTERVLQSPEMDRVVEYIATSPQILDAVSQQTQTLAEEIVADVRRRSQSIDDVAERTVRGWLRRPRPSPS